MIILGLDISLADTGIVIIKDGTMIMADDIKMKPEGKDVVNRIHRMVSIYKEIKTYIPDDFNDPSNMIVIEGYSFASKGSGVSLAENGGIIRSNLLKDFDKVAMIEIPPPRLKKFITGSGKGEKNLMLLHTYKMWGQEFSNNNTCDAFGLALLGYAAMCYKNNIEFTYNERTLTKDQLATIKDIWAE